MRISYSVENIRRLAQVEPIEIRPITVLVGRNSAGKSTFLRSLPLIRQSIETRSSAPILWYGDLVDFGDFKTAISEDEKTGTAVFSFKVDKARGRIRRSVSPHTNYRMAYGTQIVAAENLEIRYFVGADGEKTVLKKISLKIPNEDIQCEISYHGRFGTSGTITINNAEVTLISQANEIVNQTDNLFSSPSLVSKVKDSTSKVRRRSSIQDALVSELEKILRRNVTRISSHDTFRTEVANIFANSNQLDEVWVSLEELAGTVSFKRFYRSIQSGNNEKARANISTIHKTFRSVQILELINENLTSFFHGVGYLGPARAAGERYYRKQELEVSEILPNGSNFPMFLDSLTISQKRAFSDWVENLFGYGVELKSFEGHISINLKAGKNSVNVTDTGYGVSQILPVLGTVWWASQRPPERWASITQNLNVRTIAIEQPELHLHPAHQAKLADVFAKGVSLAEDSAANRKVNVLIETHSEALINRLGELIENGVLDKNDVQIVVFSAEDDINSPTKVSLAEFDDKGALTNWPFGFFNYS